MPLIPQSLKCRLRTPTVTCICTVCVSILVWVLYEKWLYLSTISSIAIIGLMMLYSVVLYNNLLPSPLYSKDYKQIHKLSLKPKHEEEVCQNDHKYQKLKSISQVLDRVSDNSQAQPQFNGMHGQSYLRNTAKSSAYRMPTVGSQNNHPNPFSQSPIGNSVQTENYRRASDQYQNTHLIRNLISNRNRGVTEKTNNRDDPKGSQKLLIMLNFGEQVIQYKNSLKNIISPWQFYRRYYEEKEQQYHSVASQRFSNDHQTNSKSGSTNRLSNYGEKLKRETQKPLEITAELSVKDPLTVLDILTGFLEDGLEIYEEQTISHVKELCELVQKSFNVNLILDQKVTDTATRASQNPTTATQCQLFNILDSISRYSTVPHPYSLSDKVDAQNIPRMMYLLSCLPNLARTNPITIAMNAYTKILNERLNETVILKDSTMGKKGSDTFQLNGFGSKNIHEQIRTFHQHTFTVHVGDVISYNKNRFQSSNPLLVVLGFFVELCRSGKKKGVTVVEEIAGFVTAKK